MINCGCHCADPSLSGHSGRVGVIAGDKLKFDVKLILLGHEFNL
jgi:hypothetical protein